MAAASSKEPELVSVFGASWATPDSPLYATSVALGAALVNSGFGVINGGYGGCMEGVSKGATEAGGPAVGVLVPSLFPARATSGNPFLTSTIDTPSLLTRIEAMLARSPRLIVALPGTLGTLTELVAAWNVALLAPVGGYSAATIVAWRKPWEAILAHAGENMGLNVEQRGLVVFVDSVEECIEILRARVARSS